MNNDTQKQEGGEENETKHHFVCTGDCGGVSPYAGTCQADNCPSVGQELEPCTCNSPEHQ